MCIKMGDPQLGYCKLISTRGKKFIQELPRIFLKFTEIFQNDN